MSKPLKVVLLGAGVVGSQVARIILNEGDTLEARIGRRLELVGIGVRRMDADRPGIDPSLLTTDLESLVARMEGGRLPLEESLAAYQRGVVLVKYCREALGQVAQRVRILEADLLQPFDAAADDRDA